MHLDTAALACPSRTSHALVMWLMSLMACALLGTPTSGSAQTDQVWRCATREGGAATYQSTPCQSGGRALPASQGPSPEDQRASAQVAKREADLARTMSRQRIRHEKVRANVNAHASLSGPVRQVSVGEPGSSQLKASKRRKAQANSRHARPHRNDVFRAEAPSPRKRSGQPSQAGAASASPP